jgi:hypothetical protein
MGANAVTSVPTYVAGQVLDAARLNVTNSGVPVFADATARDAGFGGTGEKVLAEGQLCYLESTNVVQYYDGAAWATVGPITSGLVSLKAETAFTTAASVTCDNVFSSTYQNYVVNIRYITSLTTDFFFRLRVTGTSAATNYNYRMLLVDAGGVGASGATSQTSFYGGGNTNGTFYSHVQLTLFGPALAEATTMLGINNQNAGAYTTPISRMFQGAHSTGTAYDGFELLIGTGTITGNYSVYGFNKAV